MRACEGLRLLCSTLLVCVACARPPPPAGAAGPAEAVRDLSAALARGDAEAAWSLLSARTQQQADALARAARAAAPGRGPESGRQMLFGSALPAGTVVARRTSGQGDTAEVETSIDGGPSGTFHAVRENGAWKVDLLLGP
ncbi:MAG: hypothetical protein NVSMB23_14430 [Myxococcales bacterium]